MGISIRAYARHRGVSETAVRKAIKAGRITPEPDGTIPLIQADAQWERRTDPAQQRPKTPAKSAPVATLPATSPSMGELTPTTSGTSFQQARTANEVLKAQTSKVRLARLKSELVDRAQAIAHVFTLARAERDAWMNWPARVSASLAAELQVDPHTLHRLLEREVRQHLEELGALQPRVN